MPYLHGHPGCPSAPPPGGGERAIHPRFHGPIGGSARVHGPAETTQLAMPVTFHPIGTMRAHATGWTVEVLAKGRRIRTDWRWRSLAQSCAWITCVATPRGRSSC